MNMSVPSGLFIKVVFNWGLIIEEKGLVTA